MVIKVICALIFFLITLLHFETGADTLDPDTLEALENVSRVIHEESVSLKELSNEIEKLKGEYDQLLMEYQEQQKLYQDYERVARLREKDQDIYQYNLDRIEAALQEHDLFLEGFRGLFNTLEHIIHSLFLQYHASDFLLIRDLPEKEVCAQFYRLKAEQMLREIHPMIEQLVLERGELITQKENILTWRNASYNILEKKEDQKSTVEQKLRTLEAIQKDIQKMLNERVRDREELEVMVTELTHRRKDLLSRLQKDFDEGMIQQGLLPWPTQGDLIEAFDYNPDDPLQPQNNPGINIAVIHGQEVISVANGVVVYSDWFQGYGNLVIIDHGDGVLSLYAHLNDIIVENGTTVQQGDVIGYAGSTASLKGPMLHFAIRVHSEPQDPLDWLTPVR